MIPWAMKYTAPLLLLDTKCTLPYTEKYMKGE